MKENCLIIFMSLLLTSCMSNVRYIEYSKNSGSSSPKYHSNNLSEKISIKNVSNTQNNLRINNESIQQDSIIDSKLYSHNYDEIESNILYIQDNKLSAENSIIIYSFPPKANIYIDFELVGLTPFTIENDNFEHEILLERKGYLQIVDTINFHNKKNLIYNLIKIDKKTRSIYDPKIDD